MTDVNVDPEPLYEIKALKLPAEAQPAGGSTPSLPGVPDEEAQELYVGRMLSEAVLAEREERGF